jgi:molybdopterin molybdotransferase
MQTLKTDISVMEAIAAFARCAKVSPRRVALHEAVGQRLAEDIVIRRPLPSRPLAARDGWAVAAAETADASSRKPRLLPTEPQLIDCCRPLPEGFDAVASLNSVTSRSKGGYIHKALKAGEGVIQTHSEIRDGVILVRAGQRLTLAAATAAAHCGILDVTIRRPVIDVIFNSADQLRPDSATSRMSLAAIRSSGASIGSIQYTHGETSDLARALLDSSADVICTIGGSGTGPGDTTLLAIAEVGEVVFHGVRIRPGGSFGFGIVGGRPVFVSPGGLLDMVAVNIVFSPPFARRLVGRSFHSGILKEGKLAEGLPGTERNSRLFFATIEEDRLVPFVMDSPGPVELAMAQAAIFVPEGSRHRRKGETVQYILLGSSI